MSFHTKEGEQAQSKLFLAVFSPHKLAVPSTIIIVRWLRALMRKLGIDKSIFKAHSTRGAAVSATANGGVTLGDILNAVDWSSE